ncbi:MAG: PAS domain S-box protein [Smithella sp.]
MDRKILRILMLEDNPADIELVQFELEEAGIEFEAKIVMTKNAYLRELTEFAPDIILSDYDLPQYTGAMALADAKLLHPDIPFILVTGAITEDRAIDTLTSGAKDYVMKGRLSRLAPSVRRALKEADEQKARRQAEADLRQAHANLETDVKKRTAALELEIEEHKKTEEALRESRQKYRDVVDNANSVIIRTDQNGIITFFNKYAQKFYGYDLDEIIGKDMRMLLPQIDSEGKDLTTLIDDIIGNPDEYEENINENIKKNGELVWISWRNKAIRDPAGNITGLLAIGNDVTDHILIEQVRREVALRRQTEEEARIKAIKMQENIEKLSPEEARNMLYELRVHQIELEMQNEELSRVREELQKSHERYFDLYNSAPLGYLTINREGLILETNHTASTMLGKNKSDLVNHSIVNFILPADQGIYNRHSLKLFETGEQQVCELRLRSKKSSYAWMQFNSILIRNGNGGSPVCRVILNDISHYKQIEEDLKNLKL